MSGRAKKFLEPDVLKQGTREVARIAEREQVRVALIGGYALQLFGSPRLTGDVDVAAQELLDGLPSGRQLSFGGETTEAPNGTPVDVVVRDDDFAGLYEEAIDKAIRVRGVTMRVAQPEYIAAMKMVAGRARDDADLEWLIASESVDPRRARTIIRKHLGPYAAREWDSMVDEVQWKASRGKV